MNKEREGTEEEKNSLKDTGIQDEKYPWHLLRRTVLLLNVFLGESLICLFSSANLNLSSVRAECRDNWTYSLGPQGPRRSIHWRDLLHTDVELNRLTGGLLLHRLLIGQTAPVSISYTSR